MTPQEKAIELVDKFKELYDYGSLSKENALIAVDEILSLEWAIPVILHIQDKNDIDNSTIMLSDYWKAVREEIIKL